jgi:hypothetical protein
MPSLTSAATGALAPNSDDPDAKFTEAELIEQYIKLRDEKKRREAKHKEEMEAQFDKRMDEIETKVKARLDAGNMTSFKTPEGTAFKKTNTRYSVGDGEAFFTWVEQHGRSDMLKKDVRQDPVREYVEQHNEAPPGIAVYSEVVVQFRR